MGRKQKHPEHKEQADKLMNELLDALVSLWMEAEKPRLQAIAEELNMKIKVGELFYTVEFDYPTFHLSMDFFWCEMLDEGFELLEHEACKWVTKDELDTLDWLPADKKIIPFLRDGLERR